MYKNRFFAVVTISLLLCNSCKKNSGPATPRDILVWHKWRLTGEKINGQVKPLDSCAADNFMIFNGDSTGYEEDNNTVCVINFPRRDPWHWALSKNYDTLWLIFPAGREALPITSLNDNSFSYLSHIYTGQDTGMYETFYTPD